MRTLKLTARTLTIEKQQRYERFKHFHNRTESLKMFNRLAKEMNGKTISITRVTQALESYAYAGANRKGSAPRFYTASLKLTSDNTAELVFEDNYKNVDRWIIQEGA